MLTNTDFSFTLPMIGIEPTDRLTMHAVSCEHLQNVMGLGNCDVLKIALQFNGQVFGGPK